MKTVEQILSKKGTAVYTVSPDTPVFEALQRMAEHNIGCLVVVDNGEVVGILSERDYARKVILHGRSSRDTPVRDIMSPQVVCVSPQKKVDACMALMTDKHVRHLPVIDGGQLVGIVSIGDVVKAIIEEQQFTIEQLEHYIYGTR